MEWIDVILSFPALEFLSRTLISKAENSFSSCKQNPLFYKTMQLQMSFSIFKNKKKSSDCGNYIRKLYKIIQLDFCFLSLGLKVCQKNTPLFFIPTAFLPHPEFACSCCETCLLATKSAPTVVF